MSTQEQSPALDEAYTEHTAVRRSRELLEDRYASDGGFEFEEPDYYVETRPNGNALVVVDISNQPGGAFKYASAWGGLASLPEGTGSVVTASAGNYSLTLAAARQHFGVQGVAFTPYDLNPVKRQGMLDAGLDVVSDFENVEQAVIAAKAHAQANADVEFLHPYDNRNGIAAMTKLGGYVLDLLGKLNANGDIDSGVRTQILSPVGGGSLTAAMASELYKRRVAGDVADHVTLYGVRPQRVDGGRLDARFDGLKVEVPGSHARPFLENRHFVQGITTVPVAAVADAMRHASRLNPAVHYEPNAMVSVAAADKWVADNPGEAPRTLVALVTGRNVDPKVREELMTMPGYEGSPTHEKVLADRRRRLGGEAAWRVFCDEVVVSAKIQPTDPLRQPGAGCLNGATIRSYVAQ